MRVTLALILALCVRTASFAQSPEPASAGPFSAEPRFFAPFSATAVTRVVQRTQSGRFERTVTTTYYRDSFGRVRVEYAAAPDGSGGGRKAVLLVPNPYARTERMFLVDDEAKQVELMNFG